MLLLLLLLCDNHCGIQHIIWSSNQNYINWNYGRKIQQQQKKKKKKKTDLEMEMEEGIMVNCGMVVANYTSTTELLNYNYTLFLRPNTYPIPLLIFHFSLCFVSPHVHVRSKSNIQSSSKRWKFENYSLSRVWSKEIFAKNY